MNPLIVYIAFAKLSFSRQASFRLANLSGLFTNCFFMIFRASVFSALFAGVANIADFTLEQALTYAVMVQVLIMVIPQWGQIGVADDIRTGQISMDLARPMNYYFMTMAKRLGASCYFIFARGLPTFAIGYFLNYMRIIPSFPHLLAFFASVSMGSWITNSLHFLVELSGFWLESSRGPKTLMVAVGYFLSGSTIPIALFPQWAKAFNAYLPFQYSLNAPIEVLMGSVNVVNMLVVQIFWCVLLSIFSLFLLRRGERKITLHGG